MLTVCHTLTDDPDLIMVDAWTERLAPKPVEKVAHLLDHANDHGRADCVLRLQKETVR